MKRFIPIVILALLFLSEPAHATPSFRGRGLVTLPTAATLPSGRFLASIGGAYEAAEPFSRLGTGLAVDVGFAERLQFGLAWEEVAETDETRFTLDARVRLLDENGRLPAVALAATGLGEKGGRNALVVLSKRLNFPRAGFFAFHVGARRTLDPDAASGAFHPIIGATKEWQPYGTRFRAVGEWDGESVVVGFQTRFRSGLRVGIAYATATPRVLFAVGFGNEELLTAIEDAKRLAKRAVRIAASNDAAE